MFFRYFRVRLRFLLVIFAFSIFPRPALGIVGGNEASGDLTAYVRRIFIRGNLMAIAPGQQQPQHAYSSCSAVFINRYALITARHCLDPAVLAITGGEGFRGLTLDDLKNHIYLQRPRPDATGDYTSDRLQGANIYLSQEHVLIHERVSADGTRERLSDGFALIVVENPAVTHGEVVAFSNSNPQAPSWNIERPTSDNITHTVVSVAGFGAYGGARSVLSRRIGQTGPLLEVDVASMWWNPRHRLMSGTNYIRRVSEKTFLTYAGFWSDYPLMNRRTERFGLDPLGADLPIPNCTHLAYDGDGNMMAYTAPGDSGGGAFVRDPEDATKVQLIGLVLIADTYNARGVAEPQRGWSWQLRNMVRGTTPRTARECTALTNGRDYTADEQKAAAIEQLMAERAHTERFNLEAATTYLNLCDGAVRADLRAVAGRAGIGLPTMHDCWEPTSLSPRRTTQIAGSLTSPVEQNWDSASVSDLESAPPAPIETVTAADDESDMAEFAPTEIQGEPSGVEGLLLQSDAAPPLIASESDSATQLPSIDTGDEAIFESQEIVTKALPERELELPSADSADRTISESEEAGAEALPGAESQRPSLDSPDETIDDAATVAPETLTLETPHPVLSEGDEDSGWNTLATADTREAGSDVTTEIQPTTTLLALSGALNQ